MIDKSAAEGGEEKEAGDSAYNCYSNREIHGRRVVNPRVVGQSSFDYKEK